MSETYVRINKYYYKEDMSTSYNLWYISEEYLEPVQVFSKSKFR